MQMDAIILVAEDDEGHFSLIERNLFRSGINNHVMRFSDGQQTLDFLKQLKNPEFPNSRNPCLLILDIRMPKVDGFEVLAFMKNDSLLKKIPVIVLSTASDQQVINKCQECGCDMFVVKPVEYEDFVETMERIGHFLSVIETPSVIV